MSWPKQDLVREQGAEHKKANTADVFQLLVFFEQKGGGEIRRVSVLSSY